MAKVVNMTKMSSKEDKLKHIAEQLEKLKIEFAEVVDAFEEDGVKPKVVDTLAEALAAVDDAIDGINDVLM